MLKTVTGFPLSLSERAPKREPQVRELAFDKVQFKIQQRTDRWGYYSTVLSRPPAIDRETFVEIWYKSAPASLSCSLFSDIRSQTSENAGRMERRAKERERELVLSSGRGKGSRFWILPISEDKLAVWGTTNALIPVDRLRTGIRSASEFIDNFQVRYTDTAPLLVSCL